MKNLIIALLATASFFLSACGNKDNSSAPVTRGSSGISSYGQTSDTDMDQRVKQGSVSGQDIQSQVLGLVSATLNPMAIGSIKSVQMGARVQMSTQGQVSTSSLVDIRIYDSYVGMQTSSGVIAPYRIPLNAVSGSIVNGQISNVVFQDQYGQIILNGYYDNNYAYGTVTYSNFSYFDNSNSPQAGTLGQFQVARCAFFRCQ